MPWSTEAGSETHTEGKRCRVWRLRERDGKGLRCQVDDGCKGITESGERRTVLEGVHRTNQTNQNTICRVDLNNAVLRQDMGWSVEDERDTHTYKHTGR